MNVYDAIMKAADVIEQNWERYDYGEVRTPTCGSSACMWGHIGAALGMPVDTSINKVADKVGVGDCGHLYNFFDRQLKSTKWRFPQDRLYTSSIITSTLRAYARKYFAPAKRTDAELVADLMAKVTSGERITEDA